MPNELKALDIWVNGPAFLHKDFVTTPTTVEETTEEIKKQQALHVQVEPKLIEKFSSYPRLITFVPLLIRSKINF